MNHFVSSETRKKMSQRISGSNHPMWGKKHTEQSKRKMSLSRFVYLLKKRKVINLNLIINVLLISNEKYLYFCIFYIVVDDLSYNQSQD